MREPDPRTYDIEEKAGQLESDGCDPESAGDLARKIVEKREDS